jgi:hypothetical protein
MMGSEPLCKILIGSDESQHDTMRHTCTFTLIGIETVHYNQT